jgi:hypothetical protein
MRGMAATVVAAALLAPAAAQRRPVTLFVPAFDGPGSLGRNVATILNLQVWQTLRKAPFPNPSNVTFGDGLVLWDDKPLSPHTHDQAVRAARDSAADLVLWGTASRYGSGVVVQSYLTMPASDQPRIWEVTVGGADGAARIGIDVPRLRYEFRPIVLTRAVVDSYTSPEALKLYASTTSTEATGSVGNAFTALEQGGSVARVESNGTRGWIRLPSLSASRTEVVDFTGGIIRMFRADWDGAARLFQNVIANPATPTTLQLDAHLYRGAALERAGLDGTADFQRARELNPYERTMVSYLLMSRVAALSRMAASDPARSAVIADGRRLVAANQYLFPGDDPWLKRVAGVFGR